MHPLVAHLQALYPAEQTLRAGPHRRTWRGRRRTDGRAVCVKVVFGIDGDHQPPARSGREAQLLRWLRPLPVPRLLDFGHADDAAFVVTAWLDGTSLDRWRLRAPDHAAIAATMARLCRAVAAIHAHGVVHRDLHPGNVLLAGPRVYVLDFDLARRSRPNAHTALTRTLQCLGTPRYMAPEQVAGELAGPAADVFALGCMGWELWCGQAPWHHAADPVSEAMARLQVPLPNAPTMAPRLPAAAWHALEPMLRVDPAARPSAAAAARRLGAVAGRSWTGATALFPWRRALY